jgi:carbamoyl-phosphate synthase small subunit
LNNLSFFYFWTMQTQSIHDHSAVLLLEDGTAFYGQSIGNSGTAVGELCFNTGMTGYQEIFTDPSYFGQIMIMTNVHIGNYGVQKDEVESDGVKISGLVCKSFSSSYSRTAADQDLGRYLQTHQVSGIEGIDTRALVRHIRDKGAMNGIISSETTDIELLKQRLREVPSMSGLMLSHKVSTREAYYYGNPAAAKKVAVMDFGIKKNILRCLAEQDIYMKVFPWNATLDDLLSFNPDGFHLSNGPGDPGAMPQTIELIKQLVNTGKPLFGICLGHQLLAESQGIKTYKMKNGHRGINHPVKNLETGKSEITSQNHGFVVDENLLRNNSTVAVTHLNLNDNSIEGIRLKGKPVFSVQYHPEAAPGPHDSRYLFEQFRAMLNG